MRTFVYSFESLSCLGPYLLGGSGRLVARQSVVIEKPKHLLQRLVHDDIAGGGIAHPPCKHALGAQLSHLQPEMLRVSAAGSGHTPSP
jgi:hypothetical protein